MPETTWPEGVIARYRTVGGATVDLAEEPGYLTTTLYTQTRAHCHGCDAQEIAEWGFDIHAHDHGQPQPEEYDEGGKYATPRLRDWAQAHAETCRAMPRPTS